MAKEIVLIRRGAFGGSRTKQSEIHSQIIALIVPSQALLGPLIAAHLVHPAPEVSLVKTSLLTTILSTTKASRRRRSHLSAQHTCSESLLAPTLAHPGSPSYDNSAGDSP